MQNIFSHCLIEFGLRFAREIRGLVVAIHDLFNQIIKFQDTQDTVRMLHVVSEGERRIEPKLTVLYAFVRAHTRTFVRSISSNSFRTDGTYAIMSSRGREPSHFRSKSSGSENGLYQHALPPAESRLTSPIS